jgi:hypothetical protein
VRGEERHIWKIGLFINQTIGSPVSYGYMKARYVCRARVFHRLDLRV